jgi:hypothetical protein
MSFVSPSNVVSKLSCCRIDGMRPVPKACCNGERIDLLVLPPSAFIPASVEVTMVQPAERNGEFVTDLSSYSPVLCKLEVMSIRGRPSADETRLRGHKPQMVAIALPNRLIDRNDSVAKGLKS